MRKALVLSLLLIFPLPAAALNRPDPPQSYRAIQIEKILQALSDALNDPIFQDWLEGVERARREQQNNAGEVLVGCPSGFSCYRGGMKATTSCVIMEYQCQRESHNFYDIKQLGGPASGRYMFEPPTWRGVWSQWGGSKSWVPNTWPNAGQAPPNYQDEAARLLLRYVGNCRVASWTC